MLPELFIPNDSNDMTQNTWCDEFYNRFPRAWLGKGDVEAFIEETRKDAIYEALSDLEELIRKQKESL